MSWVDILNAAAQMQGSINGCFLLDRLGRYVK